MSDTDKPRSAVGRVVLAGAGLLATAVVAFGFGYLVRWGCAAAPAAAPGSAAGTQARAVPPTATVWTCSMHPEVRSAGPGRCPKCGMELIPVARRGAMDSMREFATTEAGKKLMEIETAPVERKFVAATIRMVGKVDYDETRLAYITAWVPGRLDRLYVDYTGVPVKKGDHLVYLYSPELLSAQEELLQAREAVKNLADSNVGIIRETAAATVEAAREKLRLWGLTAEQVAAIEKSGKASDHVTIYAPGGGIVVHKNALEGMYVNTGTRIYTIADLSRVWVKLDAYESDLAWLRYGQKVEFTTVSYPGETFTGTVAFIDPILDEKTRSVKVRVNAANLRGKLKPGMFVRALARARVASGGRVMAPDLAGKWMCPMHPDVVKTGPGVCDLCGMALVRTESLGYVSADPSKVDAPLVIPATAPLLTGTRAIVYREVPGKAEPTFEGLEVVLGPRAGDYYLVRSGLAEGDRVAVKGQFKIDSSLQIQAKPSMMTPEGGGGGGGHHHGGAGPGDRKKPAGGTATALPALVRVQVEAVLAPAGRVREAAKQKDLAALRTASAGLERAIKAVDMKALTGHAHMLWMELAMLLKNDAVEGKDARTLKDARRVADLVAEHVGRLARAFGLRAMPRPMPAGTSDPKNRRAPGRARP